MSLNAMLEIANTQNSIGSLADAIAIEIDTHRLQADTEIISEKAVKIGIKHANSEEVAAIINSLLDTSSATIDLTIVESACGRCAVVMLNDSDGQEIASLKSKGVIEIAASPLEDDEDDNDDNYVADPDSDVGDEEDDDEDDDAEADDENPNKMKIVANEEAFKLATRLHAMCCGNDKSEFAHFLTSLDKLMYGFRQSSGYTPPEVNEQASSEEDTLAFEIASLLFEETAKKKKHKSGRAGFLSAFMKIVGKKSDAFGDAWDALDVEETTRLLANVGSDLIDKIVDERNARGLESPDPDAVEAAVNQALQEEAALRKVSA